MRRSTAILGVFAALFASLHPSTGKAEMAAKKAERGENKRKPQTSWRNGGNSQNNSHYTLFGGNKKKARRILQLQQGKISRGVA